MSGARTRPGWKRLGLVSIAVATVLLPVSCGASSSSPAQSGSSHSPSATPATYGVHKTAHVRYQRSADRGWQELSVYSPTGSGGPWPGAVMIHGAGFPVDRWAKNIARHGIVVFVPSWIDSPGEFNSAKQFRATATAITERLACAVRFARSRANRYGGDPAYLSLFGFSAGANYATQIAFADPNVTAGCVTPAESAAPDNLVLIDGDWLLLGAPWWTPFLRQDPGIMDVFAPWPHLATAPRIPVHILDTGDPSMNTKENGNGAPKTFLPLRDPTGDLQRALERRKALADGMLTETEMNRLLYDELRQHGFPATFHTFGGTGHIEALNDPTHLQIAVEAMLADR